MTAPGIAALLIAGSSTADIWTALAYQKTGALEGYAAQSHTALIVGLEYAIDGTMEILGVKLVLKGAT